MTRSSNRSSGWRLLTASGVVALLLGGCSASATPAPGQVQEPPQQVRPVPAPATGAPAQPAPVRPAPVQTAAPAQRPYYPAPTAAANPYPGATFPESAVNPFVDPGRDPLSTFALDVDTASWGVARTFIQDGKLPDPSTVRVEELVNAFPGGYPAPRDAAFAIHVDGAPSPFLDGRSVLVRVGLQSRVVPDEARKPVSLTFVIDTSGSMQMDDRLETVKDALGVLVRNLRPDDSVAIVRFSTEASVVLDPTSAAEPEAILAAIDRLAPQNTTNADVGIELGFDIAERGHRSGATDRVILASDGVANVGLTDAGSILARIDRDVASGIDLVTVGVGMGNFNDALLEQLADRGNGFYSYINDRQGAEKLFRDGLTATLQVVARDARAQLEFDPATVEHYRLLGYEDRAMPDNQFRNPTADAGEVGAGMTVTALYEVTPWRAGDGHLATVRLQWNDPDSRQPQHLAQDVMLGDLSEDFDQADPHFRLAATVAAFGEILRGSPYAERANLWRIADEADRLVGDLREDPDAAQFAQVAREAARIAGPRD